MFKSGDGGLSGAERVMMKTAWAAGRTEAAGRVPALRLAGESTVVLSLTLFLPFLVHLLPSWDDSPLGAHLLPIFYAPLGALLLGRMGIALVVSFAAPWVNHLLTGLPPVPMAVMLCLELVLFLLVVQYAQGRGLPGWSLGPLGYSFSLLLTAGLGTVFRVAGLPFPLELGLIPQTWLQAMPGMAILALIGWWFSRHAGPHGGRGPAAPA